VPEKGHGIHTPSATLPGLNAVNVRKQLEIVLLAAGLALLAEYSVERIRGAILSREALAAFHESVAADGKKEAKLESARPVDYTLWSQNRIAAYKSLLTTKVDKPLAVLAIPKLRLEVPVFDGTDDTTLNQGAGRIIGTARPGEPGNIGIAAHRDGFFRSLKDVQLGDQVKLATLEQSVSYVVDAIEIVSPNDVAVLRPGTHPSLTLVTCYPFYFVGDAPQRYIVHASLVGSEQPKQNAKAAQLHDKQN
jgi:sortase A